MHRFNRRTGNKNIKGIKGNKIVIKDKCIKDIIPPFNLNELLYWLKIILTYLLTELSPS
jgi:hypothetical protein